MSLAGRGVTRKKELTPMPDSKNSDDDTQMWLEHARWYYDSVNADFDSLNRQCVAALSLAGVILVLAAGTLSQQDGGGNGWLIAAVISDAVAALVLLVNLSPSRINKINIKELQEKWEDTVIKQASGADTGLSDAGFLVEQILHGTRANRETSIGPLAALNQLLQHRSKVLIGAYTLITASLISIANRTCIVAS